MAREAQRILLGTHPEHGMEGLMNSTGVMNGISPNIWWPYITREPRLAPVRPRLAPPRHHVDRHRAPGLRLAA